MLFTSKSLVALGVRLLDRPLLIRRHHRDAGCQRGVDLGLIIGANAVAEAGEPFRRLGPGARRSRTHTSASTDPSEAMCSLCIFPEMRRVHIRLLQKSVRRGRVDLAL